MNDNNTLPRNGTGVHNKPYSDAIQYGNTIPRKEMKPVEHEPKQQYEPTPYGQNPRPDSKTLPPNNHAFENMRDNAPAAIKAMGEAINNSASDNVTNSLEESTKNWTKRNLDFYASLTDPKGGGGGGDDGGGAAGAPPEKEKTYADDLKRFEELEIIETKKKKSRDDYGPEL